MFENFTDQARRVVVLAQEEARAMGHGGICPEHLLIALTRDDTSAAKALASLGADASAVAGTILAASDRESSPRTGTIPFTPQSRKIMTAAQHVAHRLGSNYVQPEHLLFALAIVEDAATGELLRILGITYQNIQEALSALLVSSGDFTPAAANAVVAKTTPPGMFEVHVARTAGGEVSLHLDRGEAVEAAGDGSVNDGRLTLRPGEFFSIRDHSYVRDDLRYLDYATARDTAESAGAHVCLMIPSTREVTALAANGTEVVVGSTTHWAASDVEARVEFLG